MKSISMRGLFLLALVTVVPRGDAETGRAQLDEAERALFSARYKTAAELYRKVIESDAAAPGAYYGLVRALLKDHRNREAGQAAEEGSTRYPQNVATLSASGLAAYRRGDLSAAERLFRAALSSDPRYSGALAGLASIHSSLSQFKTARELREAAYAGDPQDPDLIVAHANSLKRTDHVAALKEALRILDPESEEAQNLRAHIAADTALGDRKVRRVTSPYQAYRIRLVKLMNGPSAFRGYGVRVRLNGQKTVRLLLDTGASGISVSPKAAEQAGLERLCDETFAVKGIGDSEPLAGSHYLAERIQIDDLEMADYPLGVFKSAKSSDFDGLIGADVFAPFLVNLDFARFDLLLEPRANGIRSEDDGPLDATYPLPAGTYRAVRFGNHLTIPTSINESKPLLFLIDSGAVGNLVDTGIAREFTTVSRDDAVAVRGVQGKAKASLASRVSLVFAGFRQENPDLIAIDLEKMGDGLGAAVAGVLGLPVLQQLKVTIDYEQGTVRMQRSL